MHSLLCPRASRSRGNQHSRVLACSVRRICELSRVESVSQRRCDVSSAEHWSFMRPRGTRPCVHGPWRGHARGHGPVARPSAHVSSEFSYTGFSTSKSTYTVYICHAMSPAACRAIQLYMLYSYTAIQRYTLYTLYTRPLPPGLALRSTTRRERRAPHDRTTPHGKPVRDTGHGGRL